MVISVTSVLLVGMLTVVAVSSAFADERTTICHAPGKPFQQTLTVSEEDVADHLAHGDVLGECEPLQPTFQYVCSASVHEYVRLYVSSSGFGAQRGTTEWPFRSVSAALRHAERMKLPAVELQIAAGVYEEDAGAVTRPTRIVGPGKDAAATADVALSLTNPGSHELGIQGVVFTPSEQGAVSASGDTPDTAICDSLFDNVTGHAVSQSGGTLLVEDSDFESTRRNPIADDGNHLTGTAVILSDGVEAVLNDFNMTSSEGSGIYATGDGTEVLIDWGDPLGSTISNGTGCHGAVVISDGVDLKAFRLTLDHNVGRSVFAEGESTEAQLQQLRANETKTLLGDSDYMAAVCGYNAVTAIHAASGARVAIGGDSNEPSVISKSDLAGILVTESSVTRVELIYVVIRDNRIGISNDWRDCDGDRPVSYGPGVSFFNNDLDLDQICLEIPPPLREWACSNGLDDDEDGLIDFDDPDCEGAPGDPNA